MSTENIEAGVFRKMAKAFFDNKDIVQAMRELPDALTQSVEDLEYDIAHIVSLAEERIKAEEVFDIKEKKKALLAFCRFFQVGKKSLQKIGDMEEFEKTKLNFQAEMKTYPFRPAVAGELQDSLLRFAQAKGIKEINIP